MILCDPRTWAAESIGRIFEGRELEELKLLTITLLQRLFVYSAGLDDSPDSLSTKSTCVRDVCLYLQAFDYEGSPSEASSPLDTRQLGYTLQKVGIVVSASGISHGNLESWDRKLWESLPIDYACTDDLCNLNFRDSISNLEQSLSRYISRILRASTIEEQEAVWKRI